MVNFTPIHYTMHLTHYKLNDLILLITAIFTFYHREHNNYKIIIIKHTLSDVLKFEKL